MNSSLFQGHSPVVQKNLKMALSTVEYALRAGVRTFCLCPGARNAPWVELLDAWVSEHRPLSSPQSEGVEVLNFFDERQASFFALGRIKRDQRPVAVVTTSGTAVTELYSAAVEAYYTGLPLLFMTADRPQSYRGTGAPQAIDQAHLFGRYAPGSLDLHSEESAQCFDQLESSLIEWQRGTPLQLNVCFSEPLLSGFSEGLEEAVAFLREVSRESLWLSGTSKDSGDLAVRKDALCVLEAPLVIVGALDSELTRSQVRNFLVHQHVPVLLEASSGLRGEAGAFPGWIQGGEFWARKALQTGKIKSVLRIGGVPSYRFWRDLEDHAEVPVVNVTDLPFSGLARSSSLHLDVKPFLESGQLAIKPWDRKAWATFLAIEEGNRALRKTLLEKYPRSEPALLVRLAAQIPHQATVYLGNSLPIREWNGFVNSHSSSWTVFENRGANGIDGQLSTFLGAASENSENWGVFGDLTTLYDFTAPWALRHLSEKVVRFVIINNSGGRIFERMFANPRFQTRHELTFGDWARLWSLEFGDLDFDRSGPASVIELVPDELQTKEFWNELEANSRSE